MCVFDRIVVHVPCYCFTRCFIHYSYCEATMNEIGRIGVVDPFGLPHRCTEDLPVLNYTIPKGDYSIVEKIGSFLVKQARAIDRSWIIADALTKVFNMKHPSLLIYNVHAFNCRRIGDVPLLWHALFRGDLERSLHISTRTLHRRGWKISG